VCSGLTLNSLERNVTCESSRPSQILWNNPDYLTPTAEYFSGKHVSELGAL